MMGLERPRTQRPRLSLQTKSVHVPGIRSRSCFNLADPKSPTAFNTLSNIYVTAIERSTPTSQCAPPLTAMKLKQPLKLRTDADTLQGQSQNVPVPNSAAPGTPLSANPVSPAQQMDVVYPSTMTATPPLSAGSVEPERKVFTFNSSDISRQAAPSSPARRRVNFTGTGSECRPPYTHNKSLRSILRNSPLHPSSIRSPSSPRKLSVRIHEKVERRVGYDSPLTQTIITEKYTKSHIDLLAEDASPYPQSPALEDSEKALAHADEETRDGEFTDMARRITSLAEKSIPSSRIDGLPGRKSREKKRKWVWTIGKEDDEGEEVALAAIRTAAGETFTPKIAPEVAPDTPEAWTASVKRSESELKVKMETEDDLMDSGDLITPRPSDHDIRTPTLRLDTTSREASPAKRRRLTPPDPMAWPDSPIPPNLIPNESPRI
ncbi:hypothetical protein GGR50DRAFT_685064 [Xylaria sp. CBS 124048]|nr:hypothetical protein GGR50DRAFT_685064 [Xylaria sp. CBS 124048]